ncbi:hypothetical protein Bca4012_083503 [Brassica carinata]
MSPWCRPKLAFLSSNLCPITSPHLRLLKLQSCSPLKLSFVDKFIKSSFRQGRERSFSTPSFTKERIFPPEILFVRGKPLPVKTEKNYQYPNRLLSYVMVHLGPVDATILTQTGVEFLDCVATPHIIVTNRLSFADSEEQFESFTDWIASDIFSILHNDLSNFYKFVYVSLLNVVLYAWELVCWLAHRSYDVATNLVIV